VRRVDPLLIVAIVAGALVGAAFLVVLILQIARIALRKIAKGGEERIAALGIQPTRQGPARSLGVTSQGAGQMRGSGTLALTDRELIFLQAVPATDTRIPLNSVTLVDTCMSHLGKSVGSKLLRITWTAPQGEDSIALQVAGLDEWYAALAAQNPAQS
jgi:hypothetical protein